MPPASDEFAERGANTSMLWPARRRAGQNYTREPARTSSETLLLTHSASATSITFVFAHAPSTIRLADHDLPRLGFGAMQLCGPMAFGEPEDPARARAVLKRVIELGIR